MEPGITSIPIPATPFFKYDLKQLSVTRPDRDVVVYKMHGDIDHPADAVISKDEYES
jgi:hypothetical protein